jgi:flavin reductase (DIM6/NTAB) family NADH-FMN oxidoreductase RutF
VNTIDPATLTAEDAYKLMIGVVVPRPIAWITTLSPGGVVNLAPLSAFTFVAPEPPMVAISVGTRGGRMKDTARNVMCGEAFVVNIASEELLAEVHASSFEYGEEESEVAMLGLETLPSIKVAPPRIARSPIHLECELRQVLEFGRSRNRFIVGEVVMVHIDPAVHEGIKVDTAALRPLARLAGPHYAGLGEIQTVRPATRR